MPVPISIDNRTSHPVALVGLDNYATWSKTKGTLSALAWNQAAKEAVSDGSVFDDYTNNAPDTLFWRYVAKNNGVTDLLEWKIESEGKGINYLTETEFLLLWQVNAEFAPQGSWKLPFIGAEYGTSGVPCFRVKLTAKPEGSKSGVTVTLDRPALICSGTAKGSIAPVEPEKVEGEDKEPKYLPLGLNGFGLGVTASYSGGQLVITFEQVNSLGDLARVARLMGCPAPTACWRNTAQLVSLVREEPDRNGNMRWDEYHGYNCVAAYQEVPSGSPTGGTSDHFIYNYNSNRTVKLTRDSGAFLHVDPPSPADGSAPSFATPVDQIVWKDHLAYCESGGFMPG